MRIELTRETLPADLLQAHFKICHIRGEMVAVSEVISPANGPLFSLDATMFKCPCSLYS